MSFINIPWQVFSEDGEPIKGSGIGWKAGLRNKNITLGVAHVIVWRHNTSLGLEILIQKRSSEIQNYPGYLDVSAGGHIDIDELPIDSAVREAKEEIGLTIDPNNLNLIQKLRADEDQFIFWVYSYEVSEKQVFILDNAEVESVSWWTIDKLEKAVRRSGYKFIPHSNDYWDGLLNVLRSYEIYENNFDNSSIKK